MAGETAQMPHGRASGAYRNPRNTAGKNKKNYINISPEKKAEEIALSVVAMAYEAKTAFSKAAGGHHDTPTASANGRQCRMGL